MTSLVTAALVTSFPAPISSVFTVVGTAEADAVVTAAAFGASFIVEADAVNTAMLVITAAAETTAKIDAMTFLLCFLSFAAAFSAVLMLLMLLVLFVVFVFFILNFSFSFGVVYFSFGFVPFCDYIISR